MKRLNKRKILSEWVPTSSDDPNVVQYVTNVMSLGGEMQIQYQDGGYRTIFPYGWNTSQDGNILIMCYKDSGEVRSYRLDRIQQFVFDSSVVEEMIQEDDGFNELFVEKDYIDEDFPTLPDVEEDAIEVPQELPYDEALDVLDYEDNQQVASKTKRLIRKGG